MNIFSQHTLLKYLNTNSDYKFVSNVYMYKKICIVKMCVKLAHNQYLIKDIFKNDHKVTKSQNGNYFHCSNVLLIWCLLSKPTYTLFTLHSST